MTYAHHNAFPGIEYYDERPIASHPGLTTRELFAAMAMQGILAADMDWVDPEDRAVQTLTAKQAVSYADALIAALNEAGNNG
uniref:Uncharacterized protein n=1 Tax=Oscillatoriales cyanobacterium SpSt-402 TaxID=2282168 RepID=A0A832H7Z3_9CYAN